MLIQKQMNALIISANAATVRIFNLTNRANRSLLQ